MSPATTEVTAAAVERDVDDEVAAGHPGDPGVFFVHRVALEDAAVGLGVLEELGAVPDLDRLQRGHARADQLAAAGIAGHQVRLDQAGGDLQVGPDVAAVDPAGHPARRRAEAACARRAACRNGLRPGSSPAISGAEHLDASRRRCWAGAGRWRPGSGSARGDAGLAQDLEHRPEDRLVGHRPRDVADQDAGVFAPSGQLGAAAACRSALPEPRRRPLRDHPRAGRRGSPAGRRCDPAGSSTANPVRP